MVAHGTCKCGLTPPVDNIIINLCLSFQGTLIWKTLHVASTSLAIPLDKHRYSEYIFAISVEKAIAGGPGRPAVTTSTGMLWSDCTYAIGKGEHHGRFIWTDSSVEKEIFTRIGMAAQVFYNVWRSKTPSNSPYCVYFL